MGAILVGFFMFWLTIFSVFSCYFLKSFWYRFYGHLTKHFGYFLASFDYVNQIVQNRLIIPYDFMYVIFLLWNFTYSSCPIWNWAWWSKILDVYANMFNQRLNHAYPMELTKNQLNFKRKPNLLSSPSNSRGHFQRTATKYKVLIYFYVSMTTWLKNQLWNEEILI